MGRGGGTPLSREAGWEAGWLVSNEGWLLGGRLAGMEVGGMVMLREEASSENKLVSKRSPVVNKCLLYIYGFE